jgi:hypothetical protein
VVLERLSHQLIQLPGGRVGLDLSVPRLPVVFSKPITECSKLLPGELLYFSFDRFDFGMAITILRYVPEIPPPNGAALTRANPTR